MRFLIVSAGWECADWIEQTLESVAQQTLSNWVCAISYDPSTDNGAEVIEAFCARQYRGGARDDHRWRATINTERKFATRNHYESIKALDPQDDDVIIFLDLDGDQLAHPQVLERIGAAYADGALVTYGAYRPIPDPGTCGPARPYPPKVVKENSYRTHECCFNHPRTMSGRVFNAIPEAMFHWQHGGHTIMPNGKRFVWQKGDWYEGSTDYLFMICALELAGGRYKCFEEVLLLYNHDNPRADNKTHPQEAEVCLRDFFSRPPLKALPPTDWTLDLREPLFAGEAQAVETATKTLAGDPFLPPEERRAILRDYGQRYKLRVFIETGTNDGATPMALKGDFEQLYTIELARLKYEAARIKFAAIRNVQAVFGDSTVVLPDILRGLSEPALIWLDGHWSGGDTARGPKDTPVIEELQAIFATGVPHVVLVDDARLLDGMPLHDEQPNWPHIDEIRNLADKNLYGFDLRDDIIRLVPRQFTE